MQKRSISEKHQKKASLEVAPRPLRGGVFDRRNTNQEYTIPANNKIQSMISQKLNAMKLPGVKVLCPPQTKINICA